MSASHMWVLYQKGCSAILSNNRCEWHIDLDLRCELFDYSAQFPQRDSAKGFPVPEELLLRAVYTWSTFHM